MRQIPYKKNYSKIPDSIMKKIETNTDEVDFNEVCKKYRLSEKFIRKYSDKFDWNSVMMHQNLSEKFIEEFLDKLNLDSIFRYHQVSEKFIRERMENLSPDDPNFSVWCTIFECQTVSHDLTREFIVKYKDIPSFNFMQKILIRYHKLHEDLIEEFSDVLDIKLISECQRLTLGFIRKFPDRVDWSTISNYNNLSVTFIREFFDKLDIDSVLDKKALGFDYNYFKENTLVPEDLLDLRSDEISTRNWNKIFNVQKLSEEFAKKYIRKVDKGAIRTSWLFSDEFLNRHPSKFNWEVISTYNLSMNFIRSHKILLNWTEISESRSLTLNCIEEFADRLDWREISDTRNDYYNFEIDIDFVKKFIDYFDFETYIDSMDYNEISYEFIDEFHDHFNEQCWYDISFYNSLNEDFIRKYSDKVNWDNISKFQKLSPEFIMEFKDKVNWKNIVEHQKLSKRFIVHLYKSNLISSDLVDFSIDEYDEEEPVKELLTDEVILNFIKENLDSTTISKLWEKYNFPDSFINDIAGVNDKSDIDWNKLILEYDLPIDLILKNSSRFDWAKLSKSYISERVLLLFKEDLRGYFYKMDWESIFNTHQLSEEFIIIMWDEFDEDELEELCRTQKNLPAHFIKISYNCRDINWSAVSENKNLPEEFLDEFEDKINWNTVTMVRSPRNMSIGFFRKHEKQIRKAWRKANHVY